MKFINNNVLFCWITILITQLQAHVISKINTLDPELANHIIEINQFDADDLVIEVSVDPEELVSEWLVDQLEMMDPSSSVTAYLLDDELVLVENDNDDDSFIEIEEEKEYTVISFEGDIIEEEEELLPTDLEILDVDLELEIIEEQPYDFELEKLVKALYLVDLLEL